MKAQMGSRSIALLFLQPRRWMGVGGQGNAPAAFQLVVQCFNLLITDPTCFGLSCWPSSGSSLFFSTSASYASTCVAEILHVLLQLQFRLKH
jgi:hypothetical protein